MAKEKAATAIDVHADAIAAKEAAEKAHKEKVLGAKAVQVLTASLTVATGKAAALELEHEAAEKLRLEKAAVSLEARRKELGLTPPAPVESPPQPSDETNSLET